MNIEIKKNIDLASQTTFKIGGKARYFTEVYDEAQIIEAVRYAQNNNLEIFVLGGGSNVLISDNGFEGLVIKIKNNKIEFKDGEIICGAGAKLMDLVNFSVKQNLSGLEWAAGIPGTVGGAVRGNAGAFGGEMKDSVSKIKVLDIEKDTLKAGYYLKKEIQFGYRNSIVKMNKNLILIEIKLKLSPGSAKKGKGIIEEILAKRANNQPSNPSAGSFFKNPVVSKAEIIEKFEHDMEMKMRGEKLPAGWFIDDLGFKGKKIGGAQVSEKHGNFIINTGKATAEDVIILSSFLKQKVRDSYGIQLEEEISRVGF